MKPLFVFETPTNKTSSVVVLEKKIEDVVLPALQTIKYKYAFQSVEELHEGLLLQITKRKSNFSILVVPWVRTAKMGLSVSKTLSDYPRLAVPKQLKHLPNEEKLERLQNLSTTYQLYFLVVLQRTNREDLFWLARYDSIPTEYWKMTYRTDKNVLDRVHFTEYDKYNFVSLKDLQKQLNSILA